MLLLVAIITDARKSLINNVYPKLVASNSNNTIFTEFYIHAHPFFFIAG